MIRLLMVAEIEEADTIEEAIEDLDAFRESVLPSVNYGIVLYIAGLDDVCDLVSRDSEGNVIGDSPYWDRWGKSGLN